jgi:hypothetical protein
VRFPFIAGKIVAHAQLLVPPVDFGRDSVGDVVRANAFWAPWLTDRSSVSAE